MKKMIQISALMLIFISCGTQKQATDSQKKTTIELSDGKHPQILANEFAFLINSTTDDKTYGYEPTNAIKVGGAADREGPTNERRFLNAIAGPNGEAISYERQGSCCPQPSKNGLMGDVALLDKYAVWYEGSKDTLVLYINMYDSEKLFVPVGLSKRDF